MDADIGLTTMLKSTTNQQMVTAPGNLAHNYVSRGITADSNNYHKVGYIFVWLQMCINS